MYSAMPAFSARVKGKAIVMCRRSVQEQAYGFVRRKNWCEFESGAVKRNWFT
jgi:hypothetical protein